MRQVVEPEWLSANGLWNHFTGKKKYKIQCGHCLFTFQEKVPFGLSDEAQAICPSCGNVNRWNHSAFAEMYKEWKAARK